ncbi:TPA: hypothetical protein TUC27_001788 [Streptococcus equi subsp. zooepidemicus]|nr:hypothetical protein [Streptococcus equi subsp. zooepidemicus]HEL0071305.1 hypothetical protein [Streptococcus equi subsp. zooepidemicus]HEL0143419.1 hypothetical protein [Streptococcus equi subsp. zooepidemicus]HEL0377018.1 hypothetical protein [Streptococcus equi subsp. zooepidemicus]
MKKLKYTKVGIYITFICVFLFTLSGCSGELSVEDKNIEVHKLNFL